MEGGQHDGHIRKPMISQEILRLEFGVNIKSVLSFLGAIAGT